ncbi:hypothetical protein [Streptobacillus canis]|uniref:hypothetical protein n=1 Tax=Streptobacillus canis TaxID=2678686 RepID=UPI0018CC51DC|nr:hypothetical protein [Streptobacillus canis]
MMLEFYFYIYLLGIEYKQIVIIVTVLIMIPLSIKIFFFLLELIYSEEVEEYRQSKKIKEMKIILENYTVLNRVNNFIILGLLPVQTFITVKMLELLLDPKVKVSQYTLFFLVISIMFVFIYFIFNFSKKVNDIKYGK